MSKKTGARQAQPLRKCCRKCGHTRPIALFKKGAPGKYANTCKACDNERARRAYHADLGLSRARQRAKRQRNPERCRGQRRASYWRDVGKSRAQARERARTERGRECNRRAVAKYRKAHPEVVAAQRVAQKALRRGEIKSPACCQARGCGHRHGLHKHHFDYAKPREVIFLCTEHHSATHRLGPQPLKSGAGRKFARAPHRHEARGTAS